MVPQTEYAIWRAELLQEIRAFEGQILMERALRSKIAAKLNANATSKREPVANCSPGAARTRCCIDCGLQVPDRANDSSAACIEPAIR